MTAVSLASSSFDVRMLFRIELHELNDVGIKSALDTAAWPTRAHIAYATSI